MALVWSLLVLLWLTFLTVTIAVVFRWLPSRLHIGSVGADVLLVFFALLIGCGGVWIGIAFSLRCPHCEFKFLKNPKGLGPANFVYHPNCPGKRGVNGWAVQVYRFLTSGKMRCVKCGEEIFE